MLFGQFLSLFCECVYVVLVDELDGIVGSGCVVNVENVVDVGIFDGFQDVFFQVMYGFDGLDEQNLVFQIL